MRKYLLNFLNSYGFDKECIEEVLSAFDSIQNKNALKAIIDMYNEQSLINGDDTLNEIIEKTSLLAGISQQNVYTINLIVDILLTPKYSELFLKEGNSEQVLKANLNDIKWQCDICKAVDGVYGLSAFHWSLEFLKLKRFTIGRLQFDINYEFPIDYSCNDATIIKGTKIVNIHIPRTGEKLDYERCKQSIKSAKEYFNEHFSNDEFNKNIYCCHSWLLSPDHKEILSKDSNIVKFISLFDVFETGIIPNYNEVWRFFDKKYEGNVDALPGNTSIRRAYKEMIKKGIPSKYGYGVHIEE